MEKINQIFYPILKIFILSISINTFLKLKEPNKNHRSDIYWTLAIILLIPTIKNGQMLLSEVRCCIF